MPVFLSSEVSPRKFEYTRTTMTVLNAYLHQSMYEELIGIGQELRARGYRKPLMMVHNTGGMASVFRSAGGAHLQRRTGRGADGQRRARAGSTATATSSPPTWAAPASTSGWSSRAAPRFYQFAPTIDRWTVDATILDTRSIGAGGGSIARVNALLGNRLEVGPRERRARSPGPAAYDQGGTRADGHRRRPGARLPQPRALPRRPAGAQRAPGRARDRDAVATPLGIDVRRGGAADQADHRREDGRRDLQGDRAQGLSTRATS